MAICIELVNGTLTTKFTTKEKLYFNALKI